MTATLFARSAPQSGPRTASSSTSATTVSGASWPEPDERTRSMRLATWLLIAAAVLPAPALAGKKPPKKPAAAAQADPLAAMVVSDGKETILVDHLKPEGSTVV